MDTVFGVIKVKNFQPLSLAGCFFIQLVASTMFHFRTEAEASPRPEPNDDWSLVGSHDWPPLFPSKFNST